MSFFGTTGTSLRKRRNNDTIVVAVPPARAGKALLARVLPSEISLVKIHEYYLENYTLDIPGDLLCLFRRINRPLLLGETRFIVSPGL